MARVEQALAAHFGRPVPTRLAVDAAAAPAPAADAPSRTTSPSTSTTSRTPPRAAPAWIASRRRSRVRSSSTSKPLAGP